MPEGDTIHLAALRMRRVLEGKRVVRCTVLEGGEDLVGRAIVSVVSRGKNLLITFDDAWVLHTHMRMTGSWHLYRPGGRWWKPAHRARVALEVADAVAVCFDAPVVLLMRPARALRTPTLATLGPDFLAADFDEDDALARLRAEADAPLGVAILLQRVAAGVGNIWKSETLFVCRADPFAPVSAYDDDELRAILRKARELLRASVVSSTTLGAPVVAPRVYLRSGRPCRTCGTAIAMRRQGDQGRSTYYCPRCQRPRAKALASDGGT